MKVIFNVCVFAALILGTVCTVAQTAASFPDTPAGKRAAAYVTAFNSGDEAVMRRFLGANIAPEALTRRPIEDRLQTYRLMRGDLQTITLEKIVAASDSTITALITAKSGSWFRFTFLFDPSPQRFLLGMRMEEAEPSEMAQDMTPLTQPELLRLIAQYLDSLVKADEFSGTVLIARDGAALFTKAYGLASKAYDVPNRLDTKFNLGSINKIFTMVAICQLAEKGKLSFDDRLGKWLPDYPNADARENVMIKHLLTMSSGVGDFFGERFEATPKDRIRTIDDYVKLFADQPLQFEPGSQQQYSNGGFVLLGAIIERVSGMTYYDYVRANIFELAGMTSTDSYEADIPTPNLAEGYTRERTGAKVPDGTRISNTYTRPARGSSAGGGYSTAEDLLRFSLALRDCKLLSYRGTQRVLERNFSTSPAGDSAVSSTGGKMIQGGLGIAGGAPGINAVLDCDYGTGFASIVMGNYDSPNAERVAKQIRGLLARLKP